MKRQKRSGQFIWVFIFGAAALFFVMSGYRNSTGQSVEWFAAAIFLVAFLRAMKFWKQSKDLSEDSTIVQVNDEEKLAEALEAKSAILYKHSTTCSISAKALREVREFSRQNSMVPVYLLDVRQQRDLSNQVANRLGIRHESPQVIIIKAKKPVWNASHFEITAESLSSQMKS
ncbi:MAG: bacillithiol system redox-active protein YtxJ [bacterium]